MSTETERLDRLEREMAIIRAEFARLREQLRASGTGRGVFAEPPQGARASSRPDTAEPPPPRPAQPPPPRSSAAPEIDFTTPSTPRRSWEDIIGGNLTIAIALPLVLVAVGSFLSWAIRSGLLGPQQRVIAGYAAAMAIAYGGLRLRLRGTRQFGNVLLAMALGVVHLVCWSAGPLLHVLPSWAALGIGLLASVLLAEFALRHDEETLCAVGFGGATLAPFIASDGGSRIALAVYGIAVVALGAAALGSRQWKVARAITMASIVIFTLASGAGLPAESPPAWLSSRLWVLTPMLMLIALIPFTHAVNRRTMIRVSAFALIIGGVARADQWGADLPAMLITIAGTLIVIAALDVSRVRDGDIESDSSGLDGSLIERDALIDAFAIPLGLFVAAVAAAPEAASLQSAVIAVIFVAIALYMTHRTRAEPEGNPYASSASVIALWIVPAALMDQQFARAAGSAAMGIALMMTAARMNRLPLIGGAIGALVTASFFALDAAAARQAYEYLPFLTVQSLACLVAIAGWVVAVTILARPTVLPELASPIRASVREGLITGASVTAFIWGAVEFDGAWSATASTALLILYYAASGALMIRLGRLRDVKRLRFAGLAVALWAAGKAVAEVFGIPNVAVRIAVFTAVAAFLTLVAYWYRRDADESPTVAAGLS